MVEIGQNQYNFWSLAFQVCTTIAAVGFAFWQTKINSRLERVQNFVAVSVIPLPNGGLNITNVGKANLYLKRWEIGQAHELFEKAILLPAVNGINITITTPGNPGEYPIRLYLYDG